MCFFSPSLALRDWGTWPRRWNWMAGPQCNSAKGLWPMKLDNSLLTKRGGGRRGGMFGAGMEDEEVPPKHRTSQKHAAATFPKCRSSKWHRFGTNSRSKGPALRHRQVPKWQRPNQKKSAVLLNSLIALCLFALVYFCLFGCVFFFPRASERRVLPIVGVCKTSSPLHIFPSSHPHIFTSSHLHIFTSSHPLIVTSSHLHILSSSHPHIFTAARLHILTSSHLHILSSSHPLIFTSSHLHILSSSHPHIFTAAHLYIFTSSHPLIFTSSHLHICSFFTSSHLHIFSSCPLALSFFSISLLKARGSANETARMQPFRTKWGLIAKNWGKIAICKSSGATLPHEMRFDRQKTEVKLRFASRPAQPFRTKWGSIAKNWSRIAICKSSGATLSHEMRFDRQKTEVKLRFASRPAQPFRTKWGSIAKKVELRFPGSRATLSHEMRFDRQKTEVELRFPGSRRNPFARNQVRSPKTEVKLRFLLCVNVSVYKLLCAVCKSFCV